MEDFKTNWQRVAHIMTGALMPLIGPEKAQKILAEAIEDCPVEDNDPAPTLARKLGEVVEWLDRETDSKSEDGTPYAALVWRLKELRNDLSETLRKVRGE